MKPPKSQKETRGGGKITSGPLALVLGIAVVSLLSLGRSAAPVRADTAFSPQQITAIQGIIHAYLVDHPEVVVDALSTQRDRIMREKKEAVLGTLSALRNKLERADATEVAGNADGDISVVEFFDYRCPYCKRALPALTELIANDPNIRLVYREFPILGANSVLASRAAIASRKQGKYLAYHDALMSSKIPLDQDSILRIAEKVGLDTAKLLRDMADPKINRIIGDNRALARELNLSGTPAFVIGDTIVPGLADYAQLSRLVDEAREKCVSC